ncbi:MAG: NAD(P)/FAD-dependent oxidoreductase [Ferruginibacter sp.]
MDNETIYDCAIIGGGLAGLTLAIQLAKQDHKIILFEKEQYPFHKVCGEYISMESWDFLERLGLSLRNMNLPRINKLMVSAPGGAVLNEDLPLGGFGISRYKIDNDLKNIAKQEGVTILENCKAEEAVLVNDIFYIQTSSGKFKSRSCCGSFGKRSNLDIKWKRSFIHKANNKLNNYIGVKYHIQTSFADDSIALHNFKNGYCGISRIEDDKYCLCYLTNAANLKNSGNSIEQMEKNILGKNPFLKNIFENSSKLYSQPLSISQVSFQQKTQVENNILLVGDAAGMITPLCGNGMSMAMHGSKIAAGAVNDFLRGKINRKQMETFYTKEWNKTFGIRLRTGRIIQRFFGKIWMTNLFVRTMKLSPSITKWLIRQTHGERF